MRAERPAGLAVAPATECPDEGEKKALPRTLLRCRAPGRSHQYLPTRVPPPPTAPAARLSGRSRRSGNRFHRRAGSRPPGSARVPASSVPSPGRRRWVVAGRPRIDALRPRKPASSRRTRRRGESKGSPCLNRLPRRLLSNDARARSDEGRALARKDLQGLLPPGDASRTGPTGAGFGTESRVEVPAKS